MHLCDWRPKAPLQPLTLSWATQAGIELACLRLDLIDPLISGNKWYKLAPQLAVAQSQGAQGVISLGGAHSNHLHALAAAGQRFGFATVGLLRGEACTTPTVSDLQRWGMQLHWLGYGGYRQRHEADFWLPWQARYPNYNPIAEGGKALLGAQGLGVIAQDVNEQLAQLGWDDFDAWWLAAGTGTTLAGVIMADQRRRCVYGALAVPASHGVQPQVEQLLAQAQYTQARYCLVEAARGGFAKTDETLLRFMAETETECGVPLEPLYTGKALLALRDAVARGELARGTRLVFVHTGGLQGWRASML